MISQAMLKSPPGVASIIAIVLIFGTKVTKIKYTNSNKPPKIPT